MLAALPFELQVLATHKKLKSDFLKLSKCSTAVRTKWLHLLSYICWMDCGRTDELVFSKLAKGQGHEDAPKGLTNNGINSSRSQYFSLVKGPWKHYFLAPFI